MPETPDTLRALIERGPWCQTELLRPYADAWERQLRLADALAEYIRNHPHTKGVEKLLAAYRAGRVNK